MSDSDISGIINIVKSKIRKWTCQLQLQSQNKIFMVMVTGHNGGKNYD